MSDAARFKFSGRDSMAQFMAWMVILQSPILCLPLAAWRDGGLLGVAASIVAMLAIIGGLRASIVIEPSRVVIVRKCFFIPYWRHTGRAIKGVWFSGDWGDPEGALGVVVDLDGRQIHIGSGKTMHYLYSALLAVPWRGT